MLFLLPKDSLQDEMSQNTSACDPVMLVHIHISVTLMDLFCVFSACAFCDPVSPYDSPFSLISHVFQVCLVNYPHLVMYLSPGLCCLSLSGLQPHVCVSTAFPCVSYPAYWILLKAVPLSTSLLLLPTQCVTISHHIGCFSNIIVYTLHYVNKLVNQLFKPRANCPKEPVH